MKDDDDDDDVHVRGLGQLSGALTSLASFLLIERFIHSFIVITISFSKRCSLHL